MAPRVPASFFQAREVALIGYSRRHAAFCSEIKTRLEALGSTVYPVNPNPGEFGVPVYGGVAAIPSSPELAVVLTNKSRNAELLPALAAKGVRRVAFGSSVSADAGTLALCAGLGMEGVVACPLMALGGGFHRFHGWLAGVAKVGVAKVGVAKVGVAKPSTRPGAKA